MPVSNLQLTSPFVDECFADAFSPEDGRLSDVEGLSNSMIIFLGLLQLFWSSLSGE